MARKLVVEIVGDASSLDRSFKRASNSATRFERDMGAVTRGSVAASGAFAGLGRSVAFASGGFLGGVGLTAAIKGSVSAASDLEQQVSKTNVVFGESAGTVLDWSKTLVESFGLSERAALATASSFGALFAPLGLTGAEAAKQSEALTELGADLASFYNTDVASALDAIRSGLVGEAEPLRRYGVLLSETRVQQEALNQTGKKSAANLTVQEKALARIRIIFGDTAQAQGDFGRTQDTAANQVKIFQANLEDLKVELGQGLIPALTDGLKAVNKFVDAFQQPESKEKPWWAKSGLQLSRDLFERLPGNADRFAAMIPFTSPNPPDFPRTPEPFIVGNTEEQMRALEKSVRNQEKVTDLIRRARAAARAEAEDRAQLAVDRAALTKTLSDDLAALQRFNALLARRIAGGHGTIALEREQLAVQLQIQDIVQQQAEARKAAREEAQQRAREARDARQFGLLGLGPTGEDRVPGVGALQKQLQSLQSVIAGSFLDTKKTRSVLSGVRAALRDGLRGMSEDVRRRIQEILADLRVQLKQSSVDVTRFQKSARGQFVLAGAHGAGSGTVTIQGGIHLHGVQSVAEMEQALAKRRKQRARQRRSTR